MAPCTTHASLARIALTIAAVLLACDSSTDPGSRLPQIQAGVRVEGSIAPGDSMYEYSVPLDTSYFRLLLLVKSGSASDTLVATLVDGAGAVVATVRRSGSDTSFARSATEWLKLPIAAGARLRIKRQAGSDGRYVVQLFRRNPAPETLGATVTIGQLVQGEALDVSGDVDEFRIQGNAGDEWVLFAQKYFGFEIHVVEVARDSIVGAVAAPYFSEPIEFFSSGRFILPRSGAYLLRAWEPMFGEPGAYSFRLDKVNRAPEQGPAATALGSILTESIGVTADVDEFTFSATAGQEMNLMVQLLSGMSEELTVQVVRGTTVHAEVRVASPTQFLDDGGTGRFTLPTTGQYTIRAFGATRGTATETRGQYRLELYPVNRASENGVSLTLNGPAISSVIDRPGDADNYTIQGTAGQLAMVRLAAPTTGDGWVMAELVGSDGTVHATVLNGGNLGPLNYSRRTELPYTGAYTVRVSGVPTVTVKGQYTLEAYTVSALPEHVPATIQIGDSVTAEKIDRPGDLDVFTLVGQAGREVNIHVGWPGDIINAALFAHLDGYTIYTLALTTSLESQGTGRLVLENRNYAWVVDPLLAAQDFQMNLQGDYAFRVFPIDRTPEGRAAAYALGDTVSGEPLTPSGDVDEYTFQLNAPTSLRAFWDADDVVMGLLFDQSTGQQVWGIISGSEQVLDFTLPAGTYRFELRNPLAEAGVDQNGFKAPTLAYRFALVPQ